MKARLFILALALSSAAGLTHAADATTEMLAQVSVPAVASISTSSEQHAMYKTRKQVFQELAASRASGEYDQLRSQYRGH